MEKKINDFYNSKLKGITKYRQEKKQKLKAAIIWNKTLDKTPRCMLQAKNQGKL